MIRRDRDKTTVYDRVIWKLLTRRPIAACHVAVVNFAMRAMIRTFSRVFDRGKAHRLVVTIGALLWSLFLLPAQADEPTKTLTLIQSLSQTSGDTQAAVMDELRKRLPKLSGGVQCETCILLGMLGRQAAGTLDSLRVVYRKDGRHHIFERACAAGAAARIEPGDEGALRILLAMAVTPFRRSLLSWIPISQTAMPC